MPTKPMSPTVTASRSSERTSTFATYHCQMLLATGAGLLLRLLLLGSKGLWLDEVRSIQVAQAGLSQWVAGTVEAYHPPLYYVLLAPWLQIVETPFLLRLPSALLGALAIPLTSELASRVFDRESARVSTWLVALSPLLVWYSQELRSYTALVVVSLAALLLVARLLGSAGLGSWAALSLWLTAGLYLHYDAVLMLPIQALFVVGLLASSRARPKGALLWLLAWAAALVAYLPWIRSPAMARFLGLLARDASYVAPLVARVVGFRSALWFPFLATGGVLGVSSALGVLWAFVRHHSARVLRWRSLPRVQSLSVLVFLVFLALSVLPRAYTVKRHILVGWVPLLVGFGWLWSGGTSQRTWRTLVFGLSLVASLVNVVVVPKTQWREAVSYVLSEARLGDVVALSPAYMRGPFDYYAQGHLPLVAYGGGDAAGSLAELTPSYERVWYVYHTADVGRDQAAIGHWLTENAGFVSRTRFYRVDVLLYSLE